MIKSNDEKEKEFGLSLGSALNKINIPNIAIEIGEDFNDDIFECVDGILRLISNVESQNTIFKSKEFKFFDRTIKKTNIDGLFFPLVFPLQKISKGDIVGKIKDVINQNEILLISDVDCYVMQISKKRFVRAGDDIFAIGMEETKWKSNLME